MSKAGAALKAAMRWFLAASACLLLGLAPSAAAWNQPWKNEDRALVIDAYEFNPIDWHELIKDERIAGFINKASDGLPPDWSCRGLSGDDEKLCKNRWWKYSVTQELYMTRRAMAKQLGLKWGAYHLGRPGNPREQADHFIDFAQPAEDELIVLDIEDNTPEWMSLEDAEIFADQIKIRTGRYPVLYTNGSTAAYIDQRSVQYPLLSRLPLWYARYRDDITGLFPETTWPTYALWQFSSMHNCTEKSCPYRVGGAKTDIDVNVSPLTVAELKAAWPFAALVGGDPAPDAGTLLAGGGTKDMMVAAYGPSGHGPTVDPLALLTEAARREHQGQDRQPILSSLTRGPKVDPVLPGDAAGNNAVSRMIRSIDRLAFRMQRVWQVLNEDMAEQPRRQVSLMRPAPMPLSQPASKLSPQVRSWIAGEMRKLQERRQAEKGDALYGMAAGASAFAGDALEKGGRLTGAATALKDLAGDVGRVAAAFDTTR